MKLKKVYDMPALGINRRIFCEQALHSNPWLSNE